MVDSRLRALERAGQVIGSDEDAQVRQVNDAPESGGQSIIALEEYIGFGKTPEEVYEAARAAREGK
jgi:hypothetical protein